MRELRLPYDPSQVRFMDQLTLVAAPEAVSASRHFLIRLALSKWRAATIEEDALLIVSELVTNAVTATDMAADHRALAEPGTLALFRVQLVGLRDSVLVEVWDTSDEAPILKAPADDVENGRGLLLVRRLALRWGSYRTAGGKMVWAELPIHLPLSVPGVEQHSAQRGDPEVADLVPLGPREH